MKTSANHFGLAVGP